MAESSLLGQLAVDLKKLTAEQLQECIEEQKAAPGVPLGSVMVRKGFLDFSTLLLLLKMQEKKLEERTRSTAVRKRDNLFGRVAVEYGFCTAEQLNECVRVQAQAEAEVQVHLGELLIQKGYCSRDDVRLILEMQDKRLLICRTCRTSYNVAGYRPHQRISCTRCGAVLEIPGPEVDKSVFAHGTTIHGPRDRVHGERTASTTLPSSGTGAPAGARAAVLSTAVAAAPAAPESDADSDSGLTRQKIGRYEIAAELGRGAHSIVFKAWDREHRRFAAVKTLTLDTGPEQIDHFSRAAAATRLLDHPHLARVFEYGEDNHRLYVATEFVDGPTLRHELEKVRAEPARILELWRQLATGMAHAHQQGVVHRDLKPDNVLIDAQGKARIIDFGAAVALSAGTDAPDATDARVVGTAPYMAPEQVDGTPDRIGPATDVYGLGAVAYEMYTGRPPHVAETLPALFDKIRTTEPTPLRTLCPDAPKEVEAIVHHCLARDPARRYAHAGDLLEDLERWHQGRPPLGARRARLALTPAVIGATLAAALVAAGLLVWALTWLGK